MTDVDSSSRPVEPTPDELREMLGAASYFLVQAARQKSAAWDTLENLRLKRLARHAQWLSENVGSLLLDGARLDDAERLELTMHRVGTAHWCAHFNGGRPTSEQFVRCTLREAIDAAKSSTPSTTDKASLLDSSPVGPAGDHTT